jgi:hypothetical protein
MQKTLAGPCSRQGRPLPSGAACITFESYGDTSKENRKAIRSTKKLEKRRKYKEQARCPKKKKIGKKKMASGVEKNENK